jgi:signal transduction histidine kinase
MLDDLGLVPALNWLGRDFSRNTDLDVTVSVEGAFPHLDEPTRTCVFRVVQEALTNCVKHARVSSASVKLHGRRDEVEVEIRDRGLGFVPGHARGTGLLGMRERVEELNGKFEVESSPGKGTLIRAKLPAVRKENT